jgi:hypothetical protein
VGKPISRALWALGLALLAAFFLALVADAQAAWLPAEPIVATGPTASDPQIAVDGRGDVFVAWVTANPTNHAIVVSEHPAGGSWTSPTQRIPATRDCQNPSLAVNGAGAAILVADCKTGATKMSYAFRSVFGTWSAVPGEIAGSENGKQPRAGIDETGNIAVAWQTESSPTAVDAAYAPVGGAFGVKQVSTTGKVATEPNLAMTPTGAVDLVWLEQRKENGSDPVVQVMIDRKHGASEWTASGHLTNNFSTNPIAHGEPQIEINGAYQIVAWTQEASSQQMIARNSNGDFGGWSEPIVGPEEAGTIESPGVGIDRSGRSVAAWLSFPAGPMSLAVKSSSTSFPTGGWATASTVEEGAGGSSLPRLAVTPTGFTTASWYLGGGVARAATRPAGGTFGPPVTPTTVAQPALGVDPMEVAADGEDSVVVWNTGNHPAVAVDDRTAPALAPTASAATIGTATSFTANATDAWGPVTIGWDFGDGATASGASVSHTYASAGTKTATVTATDGAGNSATATVTAVVTDPSSGNPGGGSGGSGGGGAGSSPQPHHRVKVTTSAVARSWTKQAKAKALQVKCTLDVKGTCSAVATVTKATAKKLGLTVPKGSKSVTIGRGSAQANANRLVVVKVSLKPKALTAIAASAKPVLVAFEIKGTGSGYDAGTASARLTLHP